MHFLCVARGSRFVLASKPLSRNISNVLTCSLNGFEIHDRTNLIALIRERAIYQSFIVNASTKNCTRKQNKCIFQNIKPPSFRKGTTVPDADCIERGAVARVAVAVAVALHVVVDFVRVVDYILRTVYMYINVYTFARITHRIRAYILRSATSGRIAQRRAMCGVVVALARRSGFSPDWCNIRMQRCAHFSGLPPCRQCTCACAHSAAGTHKPIFILSFSRRPPSHRQGSTIRPNFAATTRKKNKCQHSREGCSTLANRTGLPGCLNPEPGRRYW